MDRRTYEKLVARLELDAANSPALFRGKVVLLGTAAYIALFVSLASLAVLAHAALDWARSGVRVGLVVLFALTLVPVSYVVLRMFFMRLPRPQGTPVTRAQAPRLFDRIDKVRRKLKGPAIDHVLIDEHFNAGIYQFPRWGLFGGHRNYLLLGLPYLLGMPTRELLATVAHEYGHLCGNHGRLAAWVYRQRRTFGALYDQVDDRRADSWAHWALAAALDRFMPWYNAYTFVLSRQDEYDADLAAVRVVGAGPNASGLIRAALLGRWVAEDFWPKLLAQVDTRERPAFLPYSAMRTAFRAGYADWATPERLAHAWRERSGLHDTHPALHDRVDATGRTAKLPAPIERTAAEALLGSAMTRTLVEAFDKAWWRGEREQWKTRHRHAVRGRERLQELSLQPLDALAPHELQEVALLMAEFESPRISKPALERLLGQSGGPFPKADYFYGRILLAENDDRGLEHLEAAAACDRSLAEDAANAGYDYQLDKHGEAAAQDWWDRVASQATRV